jgi:hypothetical protein
MKERSPIYPGSAGGLAVANFAEETYGVAAFCRRQTRLFGRAAQTRRRAACAPRRNR